MKIGYVTAGTVGAGHLVRGLALRRGLARAGHRGEYRMFGPAVPWPRLNIDCYTAVSIEAPLLRDPARAPSSELAAALRAYDPDLLVVDLFWAPLRHVLPSLRCEAWLLVRRCPERWFETPRGMTFDEKRYQRIVAIEPGAHTAALETVDPIVVCNPDECRTPDELRARLGLPREAPVAVVMHAGKEGEFAALPSTSAPAVEVDLYASSDLFPAAEWLAAATEVVCGAGYNAYWESRWLGYSERTRFVPFSRDVDDQSWRVHSCGDFIMRRNGADVLARDIVGAAA